MRPHDKDCKPDDSPQPGLNGPTSTQVESILPRMQATQLGRDSTRVQTPRPRAP